MGTELATVCEFYEATAGEGEMRLAVNADGPGPARLNRPLEQQAVCNLVENALAHTPPGGDTALTATGTKAATVTVADTRGSIPAPPPARLRPLPPGRPG